ncbi:PTS sugar transporter subunit IIA [Caloramator sp. CAR-1]|uniref:PTS sugar transporter subunit IIA n=1 Tax=Caloramator sp. CAR-1 TaxID=3062777 RepID=UPI0026E15BC3|nr:PTS sugar transporter subunit IIA [Caloramator sp. CAR-1]MDO6354900.1 PTS sugar transporter subunit IIA [Caloramator sp. CAR-1]
MEDVIVKNNIKLKVDAHNWEHAIKLAGEILLSRGSITEDYIQNMINSVKEYGPYIVIAPNIAIAHARPDKSVICSDISLITLKKPVEFGNKQNDPVYIVFAFSATENEAHLKQLSVISQILEDEDKIKRIINSSDEEEVYKLVNNKI